MCSAAEQCQIYDLRELEADYNVADGCNYERLNITFGCMYDSLIKLTKYKDRYSSRDNESTSTPGRTIGGIVMSVFLMFIYWRARVCCKKCCTDPSSATGRTDPPPATGRTDPPPATGRTYPQPATGHTYPQPATGGTYPQPATGHTYPQPATGGTYPQPATGGTYPQPATGGTYPPPATGGTYPQHATGGTYPPPATGGTYPPPATGGTYPQPATVGISSPYDHSATGEANLPPPSYGEVTTSGGWFAKTSSSVNKNNQ